MGNKTYSERQDPAPTPGAAPGGAGPANGPDSLSPAPMPERRVVTLRRRLAGNAAEFAVIVGMLVVLTGATLLVRGGLRRHGIPFSFGFLEQAAGFDISEGVTVSVRGGAIRLRSFNPQDTNLQALVAGFLNTTFVTVMAIALSTALGVLIGVGRLSSNWIVRQWSFLFVEAIRNTPLLIQLLVWYFAILLKLPPLSHALVLGGAIIACQQGVYLPYFSIVPIGPC